LKAKRKLIVFGAGGHAKVVIDILEQQRSYEIAGAHVAPGCHLCAGVRIGQRSLLGAGAIVTPGVTIGSKAIIGAGSCVIHDVADDANVSGVPARSLD